MIYRGHDVRMCRTLIEIKANLSLFFLGLHWPILFGYDHWRTSSRACECEVTTSCLVSWSCDELPSLSFLVNLAMIIPELEVYYNSATVTSIHCLKGSRSVNIKHKVMNCIFLVVRYCKERPLADEHVHRGVRLSALWFATTSGCRN